MCNGLCCEKTVFRRRTRGDCRGEGQGSKRQALDGHTLEGLECTYLNYAATSTSAYEFTLAPGESGELIGILRDVARSQDCGSGPSDGIGKVSAAPFTSAIDFHPDPRTEGNQGSRYVIWIDDYSILRRRSASLGFIRLVAFLPGGRDFIVIKMTELNPDLLRRIRQAVSRGFVAAHTDRKKPAYGEGEHQ